VPLRIDRETIRDCRNDPFLPCRFRRNRHRETAPDQGEILMTLPKLPFVGGPFC
jgi:hypothetical protein